MCSDECGACVLRMPKRCRLIPYDAPCIGCNECIDIGSEEKDSYRVDKIKKGGGQDEKKIQK